MPLLHSINDLVPSSKKERIGIVVLLIAIAIVAALPFVNSPSEPTKATQIDSAWVAAANSLQENTPAQYATSPAEEETNPSVYQNDVAENRYSNSGSGVLFSFDPNTLNEAGFKKLGLRDRTIRTLLNYRNKGGRFKKPDDLAKIYGLQPNEFERLRPYIAIAGASNHNEYGNQNQNYPQATNTTPYEEKPRYKPRMIDVNTADVAAYESLYGIGNKLATKIVNFREKLGGFYTVDQVGETYGVPDSTFQRIKPQLQITTAAVKKINLNTAVFEELNNHPYINSKTAFQILKHRKEKGSFSNIEEIKNLVQPNDAFEKIVPYLKIE